MKKPYFLIIVLSVVVIIVCLTGKSIIAKNKKLNYQEQEVNEYQDTLLLIKDINQNSDFGGLELLSTFKKTGNDQQSQGVSDILPDFAENAKDGVEGIYFNYPHDSSDYLLAKISLTVMPYHIYEITVGQNLNDVTPILTEKGFIIQEDASNNDSEYILYRLHHVSISLKINKKTKDISTIIVSVYDNYDKSNHTVY